MHHQTKDISGKKFGLYTAIRYIETRHTNAYWLCRCDCGTEKIVAGFSLRRGDSLSCGCRRVEITRKKGTTHGQTGTPMYKLWCDMKKCCGNPKCPGFKNYGGRGITVCDEWVKDFLQFKTDMGGCPEGHTLERTNNDKGYSPDNCIWAPLDVQANNKRSNVRLSWGGVTMTVKQWSTKLGVNYGTLLSRYQRGWSIERIFTEPLRVW